MACLKILFNLWEGHNFFSALWALADDFHLLLLLEPSVAVDTVDCAILLRHLEAEAGYQEMYVEMVQIILHGSDSKDCYWKLAVISVRPIMWGLTGWNSISHAFHSPLDQIICSLKGGGHHQYADAQLYVLLTKSRDVVELRPDLLHDLGDITG